MSAHHAGVEHLHQMRGLAHGRERVEEGFEVPARLNRQNRFQTLFQLPNCAGSARQVMVWTVKYSSASRNFRSSRPFSPRREHDPRNTCKMMVQSASVMVVSMVGPPKTDHP